MWANGHVLKVTGLDGKELRILIQDGHLIFTLDEYAILNPKTARRLGEMLIQGSAELTTPPASPRLGT